jgi:hypothetical protein
MPNISKVGCITAVAMLVVGFSLGMYPPVKEFNDCANTCDAALSIDALLERDHEKARAVALSQLPVDEEGYEAYISPGRLDYLACHKGAREASAKRKKEAAELKAKLKDAGTPELFDAADFADDDPAVIKARCDATSRDRCTVACFHQ